MFPMLIGLAAVLLGLVALRPLGRYFSTFLKKLAGVWLGIQKAQENREELLRMERELGIIASDYDDPTRLAVRLDAVKGSMSGEAILATLPDIYLALEVEGRPRHGLALLLADLGFTDHDLGDFAKVNRRVADRLSDADAHRSLMYRLALHRALYRTQHPALSCDLFENHLRIDAGTYIRRDELAKRLDHLQQQYSVVPALCYLMIVILTFEACRRIDEIIAILEALIGIDEATYRQPESLIAKLETFRSPERGFYSYSLISMLVSAWIHKSNLPRACEVAIASWGLRRQDLEDAEKSTVIVKERLARLEELDATFDLPLTLMDSHSLLLLSGNPEMPPETMGQLTKLIVNHLQGRFGAGLASVLDSVATQTMGPSAKRHKPIWASLEASLAAIKENTLGEGVKVLEREIELQPSDYRDCKSLADKLLANVSSEALPFQIAVLIEIKLGQGREDHAYALCNAFVDHLSFLSMRTGFMATYVLSIVKIYQTWMRLVGTESKARFFNIGWDVVRFLRCSFADLGETLPDRLDFVAGVEDLRKIILEVGYHWVAAEEDFKVASRLLVDIHVWDAELSQRALLERFLISDLGQKKPGMAPVSRMPFSRETLRKENPVENMFFGFLEDSTSTATAKEKGEGEGTARPILADSNLWAELQGLVVAGSTEEMLAKALGETGMLVRATFDQKGSLRWAALASDGNVLQVRAIGRTQAGSLASLRACVARHEFGLALIRAALRPGPLFSILTQVLLKAVDRLKAALDEPEGDSESWARRFQELVATIDAEGGGSAGDLLRLALVQFMPPRAELDLATWKLRVRMELEWYRTLLAKKPIQGHQRSDLDRLTQELIDGVGRIWPLDSICPFLTPETDLIFQVDDTLHAVPLAHLPLLGEPLFRQVASVRTSWSLLFESLQHKAEDDLATGTRPDRLLAISYFDRSDEVRKCAPLFHRGLRNLAKSNKLSYWGAAEIPPGSAGTIAHMTAEASSLAAIAVCGHGHRFRPGVELAEGLWQGAGCDFRRVRWLVLVSCSLGRIDQTGDRDVSGFCVEMAIRHAYSVLACRWPVSATDAVLFAHEALRHFLPRLKGGGLQANIRGRALNAARRAVLDETTGRIGLNTIAAFELYGIG